MAMQIVRITTVEGETRQHVDHPYAVDYTLCGLSTDDDPLVIKAVERKEGGITCEQCRMVIHFCKKIRL